MSGGGEDGNISFYCCGSSGAGWLANGTWHNVTNQTPTINASEWRETSDFGNKIVTQQYFSVGCDNEETMNVDVYYLPVTTTTTSTSTTSTLTTSSTTSSTTTTILPTTTTSIATTTLLSTTTTEKPEQPKEFDMRLMIIPIVVLILGGMLFLFR